MTQDDLINQLEALKKDLTNRPNDRAITGIVSRHIHTINECMEYGYSRKDIYDYIFDDHSKEIIKLDYFNNNILYRARKKFNSNPTEKRSINNEPAKQNTLNTIVTNEQAKESMNAFERLQARQYQNNSVIHNNGSTQEDLEKRLARITNNQES